MSASLIIDIVLAVVLLYYAVSALVKGRIPDKKYNTDNYTEESLKLSGILYGVVNLLAAVVFILKALNRQGIISLFGGNELIFWIVIVVLVVLEFVVMLAIPKKLQ